MTIINLGKNVSSRLMSFMTRAREQANLSTMAHRHGAVLFGQSGKTPITSTCNCLGHHICGYDVPSHHAEANCLKALHSGRGFKGCSQRRQEKERWVLQA